MKNDNTLMNHAADNIRILAAAMVEKAKSGHPGGAMGGADFINVLYAEYLQYDPANPKWEGRDRFFLDPGHMSPMLYAQLAMTGKFTMDELKNLRQWGSPTPGHPEVDVMRGIENTSGPLGQGHVFAIGAAIAAKFLAARTGNPTFEKETIYAYISDGGIQEEISQGGGRIAGHLGLDNLIMFYDANDIQLSTETGEVMTEDTAMKYRSWGWHVIEINGNDCQQIRQALDEAKAENQRPTLIIGKCIMGKGARKADNTSYEHSCKTHGAPLGGDAYKNTILNLGGDLENPFVIFDDVKEMYARREEELKAIVAERHREEQAWAEANPEKAAQQAEWFSGKAPRIDWNSQRIGQSTRPACRTGAQHDLFISRPFQLRQDRRIPQQNPCLRQGRLQRRIPPGRSSRTHHGMLLYRYDPPRRCDLRLRNLLRILRLHETCHPYGRAHETSREVHLVTRCFPCR